MRWEWQKGASLQYLTIPQWSKWGIKAAFSTRELGVSQKPYSSLNLALHVGDAPEAVLENRKIFLSTLGHVPENCVVGNQVHGTKIVSVTEQERGRGMFELASAIPECDGMVTTESIGLMCFFADCVPIYFFNPRIGMTGLAHAGWKGTAHRIIRKVVEQMKQAGGLVQDCHAAIGPCIGPCCYDVGEDIAEVFREKFNDVSCLTNTRSQKYKLDLVKANQRVLEEEGFRPENIVVADLCTSCHPEYYYSYRRDGNTGRMAAFIIKEERG